MIPPGDAGSDPDAGEPEPLLPIARNHDGGRPSAVALHAGRAYAGVGPRLVVYDLEDPSAPIRVGETAPSSGVVAAVAVTVAGDFAFVTTSGHIDGRVHIFDISDFQRDALVCLSCQGPRRILAAITEGEPVNKILAHLGLSTDVPVVEEARPPPQSDFVFDEPC